MTAALKTKLRISLQSGIQKGWSGFVWMLKILVPISFLCVLLEYSGVLYRLNAILEPVMGLLSLPPMAALPLVIGMATGIYGGIAAMVMLPFSVEQMTLIAIFLLISHNLIQEGIIQAKSGMHPLKATLIRLTASIITVVAVAFFIDSGTATADTAAPLTGSSATLIVHGMSCPLCANNVDKQLLTVPGVESVRVDMGTGEVKVALAPEARVTRAQLAKAVDSSGFSLMEVRVP